MTIQTVTMCDGCWSVIEDSSETHTLNGGDHNCEICYEDNSLTINESDLESEFESMISECEEAGQVIDRDDGPAMREWFNDWTNMLCQDGQISDEVYHNCDNPY